MFARDARVGLGLVAMRGASPAELLELAQERWNDLQVVSSAFWDTLQLWFGIQARHVAAKTAVSKITEQSEKLMARYACVLETLDADTHAAQVACLRNLLWAE